MPLQNASIRYTQVPSARRGTADGEARAATVAVAAAAVAMQSAHEVHLGEQRRQQVRKQQPRRPRGEHKRQQQCGEHKRQQRNNAQTPASSKLDAANGLLQRTHASNGFAGLPSQWRFHDLRMADAMAKRPLTKGLHGWRGHITTGHLSENPSQRVGGPFQELPLRRSGATTDDAEPPLHDSILLLPDLVSAAECAHLIAAADRWCDADQSSTVALRRIECHVEGINLDGGSHALAHVILARALWSLESLRPDLAAALFPEVTDLCDLWFKFSGREPMLNKYTEGGAFDPHQDGHALTVLVPLSTPGKDFEGGGTAFWSEATIGEDSTQARSFTPSLVMRPPIGTALLWRGHLTHAGLPVTAGQRHVFVASFDLRIPGQRM